MTPKTIRLVAEILSGTNVPRSLGVLGVAEKPRDELIDQLHLFGYFDADEAEKALIEYQEKHG